MNVFFFFVILQVTKCLAYDLEIEGMMRVGEEFLKKLNDDLHEYRKVQTTPRRVVKSIRPVEIYTGILTHGNKSRKTDEIYKKPKTYSYRIIRSFNRIKSDGELELDKLQAMLITDLKLKYNASGLVLKSCEEYSTTLNNYLNSITNYLSDTDLDIEFLLLDLVDTSNKLLYSLQKRIFIEVIDKNKGKILKTDINKVTEKIFKQNVNDKKVQIDLLCEEHNVCRTFPGFIDYFAVLISEVLKLSDDRLQIFFKILKEALHNHITYIEQITNERALDKLIYHLNNLSADFGIIRDVISILRTVMTQRYKVIDTGDDRLKNRTAAVKILFDIIDKAFENDGEEIIALNVDIVVENLRHWTTRSQDIQSVVSNFVKYFFNIMQQSISEDTKKELQILTEVILRGKSKNRSIYQYLLSKGSKFVRREDLHIYSNLL